MTKVIWRSCVESVGKVGMFFGLMSLHPLSSLPQAGPDPFSEFNALCIRTASCIAALVTSRVDSRLADVMCLYRRVPVTNRAEAFSAVRRRRTRLCVFPNNSELQ